MIGQTISHYKILEKLGEGGMGVVYKAEDTKLKRTVALKFLSSQSLGTADEKTRFVHEAQAAAALDHPNICTVHEIDESDGHTFIAMAHVDGQSLSEKTASGPLKLDEALSLATDIARGFQEAHEKGIVHRDIKSANVMVTKKGQAKITDFGLAKLAGRTKVTKTGTTVGTVAYMSPEQARGEGVDHRTDIWSLGVIIYEMLTGRSPFRGDHEQAVTYQIVHEDPEPITAVRTGVPMELERIVGKCLKKKASDRYQHVDELLVDLRNVKKAPAPTPKKSLIKYAVVTLAVVILGVVAWKLLWQRGPVSPVEAMAVAVVDFRDLGTPDDATASAGIASLVQVGLVEGGPCRVVSPQYLYELRRRLFGAGRGPIEEDQALEVARESGATMLLSGQMVTLSANPYITWQLVDTRNGKSLGARRVEGENLAMLADQIIAGVLPLLASECGVEEPTLPPPVSALTTASPEAYRHYVAGVLAHEEFRTEEAERELEHAVRLDSTFALALFELAKAHYSASSGAQERERARAYADRAWELRTRLGMKDRLRLEAYRHRLDDRVGDALGTYREMLTRWPDDREVLGDLSEILSFHWSFNEAIEVAEKGLAFYPDDLSLGLVYGGALEAVGRLEEALEAARVYIERHPGTSNAWDELGIRYLSLGLPDSAETAFRQALEIDPTFLASQEGLAHCDYARGDVNRAITRFERILAQRKLSPAKRALLLTATAFWPGLSLLYAEVGRFEKALELFEEARQYMPGPDNEIRLGHYRSRLHLRMGRAEEVLRWSRSAATQDARQRARRRLVLVRARALAALDSLEVARSAVVELRALPHQSGFSVFDARKVTSEIELAAGNPERALVILNEIKRDGVPPGGLLDIECRELLSRALQMAGKLDRAEREHLALLKIYGSHALSHYELGKIYEEMGRPADAVSAFTKFLEMWSEADEGLPQVADAQQRLTALAGD